MTRFFYRFLACLLPVGLVGAVAGAATTTAGKTAFVPSGTGVVHVASGVEASAASLVSLTADVTGTLPATASAGFDGVTVTGTPSAGQVPVASSGTAAAWGPSTATALQGTAVSASTPANQQILMDQAGTWTPTSISGGDIFQSTTPYGLWSVLNLGNGAIRVGTWGSTLYGLEWLSSLSNPPGIHQADTTTASATGKTFTVQAQNATGTTSTGGNLVLASGTGTTSPGNVVIDSGSTQVAQFDQTHGLLANGITANGGQLLTGQQNGSGVTIPFASIDSGYNLYVGSNNAFSTSSMPGVVHVHAYTTLDLGNLAATVMAITGSGVAISKPVVGDGTNAYTVHGYTTVNVAGAANVTIPATVASGYGSHYIDLTGAITTSIYVYLPAVAGAEWCVGNLTTGAFTIRVAASGTSSVNVVLPAGAAASTGPACKRVYSDGTYIRAAE